MNVLLVGVDAGVGRNTYLTDTMIVASLDNVSETVSMVSVPRDMVDVPLPDGRKYKGKINSLVSYARHHPRQFPGSDGTGFDMLRGALGELLGLDIEYHAAVNLQGFVNVINELGGINVASHAPSVTRRTTNTASAGDSRSPRAAITSTATRRWRMPVSGRRRGRATSRAARQQEGLSGIRDRIVHGGFIDDPIGLIRALGQTITTNVPRKIPLPDMADAMAKIGRQDTFRAVITSPLVSSGFDARGSMHAESEADHAAIRCAVPGHGHAPDGEVPRGAGCQRSADVGRHRRLWRGAQAEAQADP